MYLQPEQMQALWTTFAQRSPPGSELVFDAMCWLAAGRASQHPSVRLTQAQFHWGLRREADLAQAHPRLQLVAAHQVMEGYGPPYSLVGPAFRWTWRRPAPTTAPPRAQGWPAWSPRPTGSAMQ